MCSLSRGSKDRLADCFQHAIHHTTLLTELSIQTCTSALQPRSGMKVHCHAFHCALGFAQLTQPVDGSSSSTTATPTPPSQTSNTPPSSTAPPSGNSPPPSVNSPPARYCPWWKAHYCRNLALAYPCILGSPQMQDWHTGISWQTCLLGWGS